MSCLFCKIIQGEIPADKVYEDESVIAFNDIHPQAPTHILIIPKKHIPTINDLTQYDTELTGHLFQVAKQLAQTQSLADAGYRLVFNVNKNGGQEVFHIHLHMLGGRALLWPPG